MNFQLKFSFTEVQQRITFSDKLIYLGSCFSDEMSLLAKQHGFHVITNPFGTLFHPSALAQNILDALQENEQMNIVRNEDIYLDYSCSGKVFGMSEGQLREKIVSLRNEFKNELRKASYLFVTFGTAFAYHLKETNQLVGNCHKQPSQLFEKKITDVETIVSIWKKVIDEIKRFNPEIQICFTVSPVRHVKDGLHENNVSKSTLMLAIDQIKSGNSISYFPAYELVNDILRDYRFFKEDLVHPNHQAIQFVWEKFMEIFLSSETIKLAKNVNEIKIAMNHRLQYPESKMVKEFHLRLEERKNLLSRNVSSICWE